NTNTSKKPKTTSVFIQKEIKLTSNSIEGICKPISNINWMGIFVQEYVNNIMENQKCRLKESLTLCASGNNFRNRNKITHIETNKDSISKNPPYKYLSVLLIK